MLSQVCNGTRRPSTPGAEVWDVLEGMMFWPRDGGAALWRRGRRIEGPASSRLRPYPHCEATTALERVTDFHFHGRDRIAGLLWIGISSAG